jgi:hypothetical protein
MTISNNMAIIKATLRAANNIDPACDKCGLRRWNNGDYYTTLRDMYDSYGNPLVNQAISELEQEQP